MTTQTPAAVETARETAAVGKTPLPPVILRGPEFTARAILPAPAATAEPLHPLLAATSRKDRITLRREATK